MAETRSRLGKQRELSPPPTTKQRVPHPNVVPFDVRVGFHSRLKLGISRFAPPQILAAECTHATASSAGFARQRRKTLYALDTRHQIRTKATFVHASVPACLNNTR